MADPKSSNALFHLNPSKAPRIHSSYLSGDGATTTEENTPTEPAPSPVEENSALGMLFGFKRPPTTP